MQGFVRNNLIRVICLSVQEIQGTRFSHDRPWPKCVEERFVGIQGGLVCFSKWIWCSSFPPVPQPVWDRRLGSDFCLGLSRFGVESGIEMISSRQNPQTTNPDFIRIPMRINTLMKNKKNKKTKNHPGHPDHPGQSMRSQAYRAS